MTLIPDVMVNTIYTLSAADSTNIILIHPWWFGIGVNKTADKKWCILTLRSAKICEVDKGKF
jgi:hypothetical protein